jgi:glycosyltransferase involved in cell wall biosynthesis
MVDVSVVIPTRDRIALLATALRSALAQDGVTSEVIIVDDGSAQPVAPQCRDLNGRVSVHSHADPRGVSTARNTGIAHARGRWIAFLDDDDAWAPAKLARQLAVASTRDRNWVYAGHVDVDADLELMGGTPPPEPDEVMDLLTSHNSVPASASSVVVRATALARAGGFDTGLRVHEDWDLWIRLARLGPPASVPEPLVALRWHASNESSQMEAMLRELPVIAHRHDISVDYPRHLRWAAWTAWRSGRPRAAVRWYLSAAMRGDLPSLGRAAAVCVSPQGAVRRVTQRHPSDWAAAADEWLRELR